MKHFTKEEQEKYTESIRKVFTLPEEYLRRADEKLPSDSKELKKDYLKLRSENTLLGERCNQLLTDKGKLTDRVQELEAQIEKMKIKWHDLEKDPNDLPKDYKTMCICLSDFGSKYEPVPRVCVGYCDSLGWSDYMGSSLYSTVRYWCELPQF